MKDLKIEFSDLMEPIAKSDIESDFGKLRTRHVYSTQLGAVGQTEKETKKLKDGVLAQISDLQYAYLLKSMRNDFENYYGAPLYSFKNFPEELFDELQVPEDGLINEIASSSGDAVNQEFQSTSSSYNRKSEGKKKSTTESLRGSNESIRPPPSPPTRVSQISTRRTTQEEDVDLDFMQKEKTQNLTGKLMHQDDLRINCLGNDFPEDWAKEKKE